VAAAAAIPEGLIDEALKTLQAVRLDRALAARFLGAYLTEPKPGVVFDAPEAEPPELAEGWPLAGRIELDRRTRMLYAGKRLFINGEPVDAPLSRLLRTLADRRQLSCAGSKPTEQESELLQDWLDAGWIRYCRE